MKPTIKILIGTALVILSFYFPISLTIRANSPTTPSTGIHEPVSLNAGSTITLEGTFSFKSSSYFELHQDGRDPVQAVLEPAQVGEKYGLYWIRDLSMTGTWTNTAGTEIFSSQSASITVVLSGFDKGFNWFLCVVSIIIFLIVSIFILLWIDNLF